MGWTLPVVWRLRLTSPRRSASFEAGTIGKTSGAGRRIDGTPAKPGTLWCETRLIDIFPLGFLISSRR
jgi:hypothetical protein